MKMKEAGLRLAEMPARLRRRARTRASMASSWPTTRERSSSGRALSLSNSLSAILAAGMPVQSSTTCASCCGVTRSTFFSFSRPSSSSCRRMRSLTSSARASKKLLSSGERAASFSLSSSMRRCSSSALLPASSWMLHSEAASSMRSMALSGKKRSVI